MIMPHRQLVIFLGILIDLYICSNIGLYCDFEEPCAWEADPENGFTVTQANGADKPFKDFTKNANDGHFIAVDTARLRNRSHIDIIRFVSPWFMKSGPNCQLQFAFYMLGQHVGALNVIKNTQNYNMQLWKAEGIQLTSPTGGKRKEIPWQAVTTNIGEITTPFQILFESIINNNNSITALDGIKLLNCFPEMPALNGCTVNLFQCPNKVCIQRDQVCDLSEDCLYGIDEQQGCDNLPKFGRCDFESGWCGWYNHSANKNLTWFMHQGATPTEDTGPSFDHTYKNISGHYIFFQAKLARTVFDGVELQSPLLRPPPAYHFNKSSPHFNTCKIRFFYHMYGAHTGSLSLYVIMKHQKKNNNIKPIWTISRESIDDWHREAIAIPQNVNNKFYLQFVAKKFSRFRGDIGLDDITFSPECFGLGVGLNTSHEFIDTGSPESTDENPNIPSEPGPISPTFDHAPIIWSGNRSFEFNTCGAKGSRGPTQSQCDNAYQLKKMQVKVLNTPGQEGVQQWKVTRSGTYLITAMGASGGAGAKNLESSRGAFVHAAFNLTKNEILYFLIGQDGESGCSSMETQLQKDVCLTNISVKGLIFENQTFAGGGGGGGGGTFVFKMDKNDKIIPLLIAGGGGGMAYMRGANQIKSDGQGNDESPEGRNGYSSADSAGSGGGLNDTTILPSYGRSLAEGGIGGSTCELAKRLKWSIKGGFGGGGGGCTAGGGGGGYNGGNVSATDEMTQSGNGGTSFVSGSKPYFEPDIKEGAGLVDIVLLDQECPCQFMCVWNSNEKKFQCICPMNSVLDKDNISCSDVIIIQENKDSQVSTTSNLVVIIVCVVAVIIGIGLCIIFTAYRKKQAQLRTMRQEMFNNPEFQLNRLRQGAGMVTEYNPNYEFGGCTSTLQDLKEIQRENLTLVRALGQGAFGEVYQGFVSNVPEDPEILVAVKTLPELSTDQAEMDFLMEALIMSKFNHPNIVRFIGVCFEKLPRFIVLELLPGGDLKSFLRGNRPKPDRPSPLTMLELIKLATDIAKGCQYLEENHFIHRDIAARNCLLTSKGPGRVVKIADFGMARDIYRADYYRKGGKAMLPVKWMPPEAFLDGIFTSKTDVWSFGVLLWEVFSLGYMPYPGRGNQEVMQLVTSGGRLEPPSNCPAPIYHIMTQCWQAIPEDRPIFNTIIERLGYCTQDPDVINAPLPVFNRPPSTERDATVMRPPDSDDVCLQVYRPYTTDPSSYNSSDYLIPMPLSPVKTELQSASSAESIDKLLDGPDANAPLNTSPKQVKWTKNLIDNDISDSCSAENSPRIIPPAGYMSVPSQEAPPVPKGSETTLISGLSNEQLSSNNGSPIKNASRVNKSPPASIARSRPSVKNPVRDVPSLLSLDKLQMGKPLTNSDEQGTGSSSDLNCSPSHKPYHDKRSSLSLDNRTEITPYVNVNVDNIPSASSSPLLGGTTVNNRWMNHRRSSSGPGSQTMLI